LTLYESNDEAVSLAITDPDVGTAYDLTGAEIEFFIKATPDVPDADPSVVILSTTSGEIVVDDEAGGLATVTINRDHLMIPGDLVWRVDVVRPGTRRTCVYGPLRVVNL
jgi:hypothetical protein